MRSELFEHGETEVPAGAMTLQNRRLVKVALDGTVHARQGAMVAYQGEMDFRYEGAGGLGKLLKKAVTGEGVPLMTVTGQGDLFLADDAQEIFLVDLEGESLTVNGRSVLAFEDGMTWDIRRVEGVSMAAGGLFNTVFTGTGRIAVTTHGSPVVLAVDRPTYADVQSAVAWSTSLQTTVKRSLTARALVGRGSGEAFQLAFAGEGFVIVQASEGPVVARTGS
ncbi:MAG: AIM24 family protein [Phycicoccus sp.]